MAGTFELQLVGPERLLLSRQVEMVTIPAAEGDLGVLPGHSPMIVALRGGTIRVRENGTETERLFVMGGFAEITPTQTTILADEVTAVDALSKAQAAERLAAAEIAFGQAPQDNALLREAAMARLLAARAMVAAAEAA